MGSRPFKIIYDGKTVWTEPVDENEGTRYHSLPDSAVARFTGTSGGAVTTIPAVFMNWNWGNPYKRSWTLDGKGALYGRSVYQLSQKRVNGPCRRWVLWLDLEKLLIVQERKDWNDGGIGIIQYSNEILNPDLPEKLFDVTEISDKQKK